MGRSKELTAKQRAFGEYQPLVGTLKAAKLAGYMLKNNGAGYSIGSKLKRNYKVQEIVNSVRDFLKFKSPEKAVLLDNLTFNSDPAIRLKAIDSWLDRAEIVPPARVVNVSQNYQPITVEIGDKTETIDLRPKRPEVLIEPEKPNNEVLKVDDQNK